MRPRVILLATVQHTGTWFMLDLLTQSPDVSGWTFQRNLRSGKDKPCLDGRTMILQTHFGDETSVDLVSHFNELEFWTHALPTIIPLRDPALSLITRQTRHPELKSNAYIVDGFVRIARLQTDPIFVNVDRPELGQRQVYELFERLELRMPARALIQRWKPRNDTKQSPLRRMYAQGSIAAVAQQLPKSWPRLMENKNVIKPFLQQHGYPSLPWY